MRKRKKQEKASVYSMPKNVRIMMISSHKSFSVWIEGARRLLLALSGSVRIELKEEVLCLFGKGLVCETYASGAIEVIGAVEEIKFEKKRYESAE